MSTTLNFDSEIPEGSEACPVCHHLHLDYIDEEDCVSCGCDGKQQPEHALNFDGTDDHVEIPDGRDSGAVNTLAWHANARRGSTIELGDNLGTLYVVEFSPDAARRFSELTMGAGGLTACR